MQLMFGAWLISSVRKCSFMSVVFGRMDAASVRVNVPLRGSLIPG